jgi:hypothetical protein
MLARFAAFGLALCGLASAQVIGHSPGPTTRYEWNNRPYGGGWSYGGGGGVSIGIGVGVPWGYNYYAPYAAYGGPVIVAPYGYDYGYGYGPYPAIPPSSATYGYVPRPIFAAPFPPPTTLPPVPGQELDDLTSRLNQTRERPLTRDERLPVLKPSTPEQQQRSLRHMATADQQLRIGHYAGAALEYRRAIADAEDLPDNYFRLGFALAAQRRYGEAVQQWKYGLQLDPSWPSRGESLTSLFGENNQTEKSAVLHRVADYVRLDPRDPDRIFLLGVLLHFDGDRASARTLFESATRVAGNEAWLTAFLSTPAANENVASTENAASSARPVPPAADAPASRTPAPPPANIRRERTLGPSTSVPPASLNPEGPQSVPKRNGSGPEAESSSPAPEKFPDLQAPKLPES